MKVYKSAPVSLMVILMITFMQYKIYWFNSVFWNYVTGLPTILLFSNVCFTEFASLGIHLLGHHDIFNLWYRVHMDHHIHKHPTLYFLTKEYKRSFIRNAYFFIPVIVIIPLIHTLYDMTRFTYAILVINSIGLLLLADYIHDSFHKMDFFLENNFIFQNLRHLHYFHHKGTMKHNFGIMGFLFDIFIMSLRNDQFSNDILIYYDYENELNTELDKYKLEHYVVTYGKNVVRLIPRHSFTSPMKNHSTT